ncbi:MAG TPA: transglycosylase family protein [Acidimicrobiales bacterium]|nr:transglycosylase family protein [Acidimicrobiales bacterium]
MHKHPLLAFATATLGLSIGATALGVSDASATPVTNHRLTNGGLKLDSRHAARDRRVRLSRLGHARAEISAIFSKTGPVDFLVPRLVRLRALASTSTDGHIWAKLRACESGNNYGENSGNGFYGAYQFTITSWTQVGESGFPNLAPRAVQDEAARRLRTVQGWQAWPTCSAMLGYT